MNWESTVRGVQARLKQAREVQAALERDVQALLDLVDGVARENARLLGQVGRVEAYLRREAGTEPVAGASKEYDTDAG